MGVFGSQVTAVVLGPSLTKVGHFFLCKRPIQQWWLMLLLLGFGGVLVGFVFVFVFPIAVGCPLGFNE